MATKRNKVVELIDEELEALRALGVTVSTARVTEFLRRLREAAGGK